MEKLAIFVEGQTEQKFAESLVYEIAGRHRVHVDTVTAHGGRLVPRQFLEVSITRPEPSKHYYVIIYDSTNDDRVLSDIREHYDNLVAQGFREVIGIRDLFPLPRTDEPIVRHDFALLSPRGAAPVTLALAVREIEAWFIAEHTHFGRLHPALTHPAVCGALGYDPSAHDVQTINSPAEDLGRAYALAGYGYNKSRKHIQRTVANLDYAHVYLSLVERIPDVATLIRRIDHFLS